MADVVTQSDVHSYRRGTRGLVFLLKHHCGGGYLRLPEEAGSGTPVHAARHDAGDHDIGCSAHRAQGDRDGGVEHHDHGHHIGSQGDSDGKN